MVNEMRSPEAYLIPAYALVDVTVKTLNLEAIRGRKTVLSLHVNNLLDTSYAEPGYRGVDIPGMRRAVYYRMSQEF